MNSQNRAEDLEKKHIVVGRRCRVASSSSCFAADPTGPYRPGEDLNNYRNKTPAAPQQVVNLVEVVNFGEVVNCVVDNAE